MKNKLINLGASFGIDIEIYERKNNIASINTLNDELKLFQVENISLYNIKAIKNNVCINLMTENIKNTKEIVDALEEMFATQDNKNKNLLCTGKLKKKVIDEKIDLEQVKKDLLSLNNLKESYSSIKSIETGYEHIYKGNYIDNKINKCKMQNESYYNNIGVSLSIEDNNNTRVIYVNYYTKKYDFKEFKEYLLNKIELSLNKLNSSSIKTAKYNLLLSNDVVANILNAFVGSFHSKSIFMKESVLTDKLNKKIFSDKINICEDSKNGLDEILFDCEGTLKKRQDIILNGIFVKSINNLEYAIKMGEEPTGNADGVNNLMILPKDKSFASLLKELDNGVFIDEVYGLHSGIDKTTGNISLQAEGYLIENGKIKHGLNMIILSTNIFELFSNVLEVGSDLSKSSIKTLAPSLLLHDITITGKE